MHEEYGPKILNETMVLNDDGQSQGSNGIWSQTSDSYEQDYDWSEDKKQKKPKQIKVNKLTKYIFKTKK